MSIYKDRVDDNSVTAWRNASRTTDPATSHKAEAEINLGPRQKRAKQVLKTLSNWPGSTSGELSISMYEMFMVPFKVAAETPHKRLPDLEAMGLVQRGPKRKCTDSGKDCDTWDITDKGRRELGN